MVALLVSLSLALASSAGVALAQTPRPIARSELSLGGVALGDSPSRAREVLGTPTKRREHEGVSDIVFEYPGMQIDFSGTEISGSAESITSSNPRYCTPAGVCPGMRVEALTRTYGPGAHAPPGAADEGVGYATEGGVCGLWAAVSGGEIKALSAYCQP